MQTDQNKKCVLSLGAAKAAKTKCQSHFIIDLILLLLFLSLHKADKDVDTTKFFEMWSRLTGAHRHHLRSSHSMEACMVNADCYIQHAGTAMSAEILIVAQT